MKTKLLLLSVFVTISSFLFAQQTKNITGKVRDENRQALIGATVLVKGTTIGTVTDEDGKYSLEVPSDAEAILISYIGYDEREIRIEAGRTVYDVQMTSSSISLNQVVVSVSKRSEKLLDAPASISVVGQSQLERNIVTTPIDQLKTTPGVDVMRTGLVSSNVVVRGFNNIFSGALLNVVDNRIGSVPSIRVNAYQLIPTSSLDIEKIEVVRGPASALYGPNATSGVIHIITKSPLDQEKNYMTTVAMTTGLTVLDKSYRQYNNNRKISGNVINFEGRHSAKFFKDRLGYKISGTYFQGQDYPNYDPREPNEGDSLVFGSVRDGQLFQWDTLQKFTHDSAGVAILDSAKFDIRRFHKDFFIRKWTADARVDIRPIKDITIILSGGVANSHNVELTGLGAGQAGGDKGGWTYWYFQARFKWKNLFIQYFINSSNAGKTYLIPQLSDATRNTYNSTSPPTPYPVQYLVDKSKLHVVQAQYSNYFFNKLNLIYGIDALMTRPNTEGTIDGRFEPIAKLNQIGGYVQADYQILTWFKLVGALRVDYNSIIKNVAASPRAAVVFKVKENHNIRLTYNRAFDSPNTLNQFLDLANGRIPNGINIRGIGNPYGWNYQYDENKNIQFITAPYQSAAGEWITYGDRSKNSENFNKMFDLLKMGFTAGKSSMDSALTVAVMNSAFGGISNKGGTIDSATMVAIDYANFATTRDFEGSKLNVANFQDLRKINNSYTSTLELGYKGLLFKKLSITVDAYWSRVSNYVSALSTASGAVMYDWKSYLGEKEPGGKLYDNLHAGDATLDKLLKPGLNNNPRFQNSSIVASDTS
ncbi:MAG: TonB-dependent receptor, partial [Bacteroidetes bacterium]|nr:TonB-dependent receptor [Bacteroidota bacterium]